MQRIADWLLPYVSRRAIVLADTGSMLPLLHSLREQAKERLGWEVAIITLEEYPRSNGGRGGCCVREQEARVENAPSEGVDLRLGDM